MPQINSMPCRLPALAWRENDRTCASMSLGQLFAGLPGARSLSRAPSPVWRDSTTKTVKFAAMPKRQAVKIWHEARRFERQTRQPGRQDGAIGRNGLAVLHAFLFDFISYATGRLDPGHAAIARKAGISERSVRRGLAALKRCGLVNWLRRCVEIVREGRFSLEQETNAYAVLPPSQWIGYQRPPDPPPPDAGTWGDHPPLPDSLTAACRDMKAGASSASILAALESDPGDSLAASLARLGRGILASLGDGNG